MKVKELIKKLEKFDPDCYVVTASDKQRAIFFNIKSIEEVILITNSNCASSKIILRIDD